MTPVKKNKAKASQAASEAALRENTENYSAIFDQSPIAIEFYDSKGRLIKVNSACLVLFGVVNAGEVSGFKLFEDPNLPGGVKAKLLKRENVRIEIEFDFEEVKRLNLYQTTCSGVKNLDLAITPLTNGGLLLGYVVQIQDVTERKRAEAALNEQHARLTELEDIINRSESMIFVWGVKPGQWPVEFASKNVETILGYTAADFLSGRVSWPGITYQEDAPRLEMEVARYLEKGDRKWSQEYRLTTKSGEVRWFHDSNLALTDPAGEIVKIQAVVHDITGRKRAEEALAVSEARHRALFEQARDSILLLELPSDGIPIIRDANAAALRLHGYPREELLGKPISFLDADATETLMRERVGRIQAAGSAVFEARHRRKDGSLFDLEASVGELEVGGRRFLLDISRDITDRRNAEAGLREAYDMQRMLNAMLKRSLSNIPLRDKLNAHLSALLATPWLSVESKGAVFLASPAGRELVLTVQQGLSPALLSNCAKVPFGRCICGKAAATGQPAVSLNLGPDHHITCEGITPLGHYCAPITAGGKVLGVLNLYLKEGDALTESQERLVKAAADVMAVNIIHSQVEEKFSQAQKMEAVGMLAGGVAHDFNNILTAVKCYAGFIRKDLSPADPKFADTQEILNSVERAISLTQRLLAFSRRQIMAPRVVDINQILGDMVNMLRRIIGENIVLETRLFPAPCLAKVDKGQLEQVIMNLAVNARDAMSDGGTLVLETAIINPPEEFFDTRPDLIVGPLVRLTVRDTGCGMDEEVKGRLFEPFFTTKDQGKGTGLGLPMVFGIVKQSGGDIEVESEPGKGATFLIYLPLEETQLQDKEKDKEKDTGTPVKGHETVLFVEDEESLRRLGGRILLAGGYTALVASDGQEALKLMEERGMPVDLLITDVVMPGMSGRELALELARRKLVGRVLYMSGYTDEAIVKHGVLEPGIAFIYKPFTVDAVLLKLREVLDGPADQAKA